MAPANPLPPPDPAAPDDHDAGEVDLSDPDFWRLVWPSAAAPLAAPDDVVLDCEVAMCELIAKGNDPPTARDQARYIARYVLQSPQRFADHLELAFDGGAQCEIGATPSRGSSRSGADAEWRCGTLAGAPRASRAKKDSDIFGLMTGLIGIAAYSRFDSFDPELLGFVTAGSILGIIIGVLASRRIRRDHFSLALRGLTIILGLGLILR